MTVQKKKTTKPKSKNPITWSEKAVLFMRTSPQNKAEFQKLADQYFNGSITVLVVFCVLNFNFELLKPPRY